MKQKFEINGMMCAACQASVKRATEKLAGVNSADVNLLSGTMVATFDENKVSEKDIIAVVTKAGYEALIFDPTKVRPDPIKKDIANLKKRLFYSAMFLIPIMFLSMGIKGNLLIFLAEAGMALPVIYINRVFLVNGFKSLFHLNPNMDSLIAVGATASFVYGYIETTVMILTLVTFGKFLEAKSKGKTGDAVKKLIELAPEKATVLRDGKEIEINAEFIELNDVIIVKAGNKIPVDGLVIEGSAKVDQSALTGESELVEKQVGSLVLSATILLEGEIKFKATKVGQDTTLSQIIKTVEEASSSKAPVSRLADKIAGIFVPCVMAFSLITFISWILISHDLGHAISRAVCVLVVSCPCALGLATPVSIMVGTGTAAKFGILFKSAEALENLCHGTFVLFDKTGTLTTGSQIKETSKNALDSLKKEKLKVAMASGDKKEIAEKIAKELGIDEYYYELLPNGKQEIVSSLKQKGEKVIMVGDGINDSPALVSADVGLAIGAGTDIAIDSADVVLIKNDINDVLTAIKLSRRVMKIIKENLFWAFFYNIIMIPLAAGLISNVEMSPMLGSFAMSLSSVTVVTNALRIKNFKGDK